MSDLVQRLREAGIARFQESVPGVYPVQWREPERVIVGYALLREAADAIERLTADRDNCNAVVRQLQETTEWRIARLAAAEKVVEAARALFTDDVSDQRTLEGDMRAALDGYENLNSAKEGE